MAYKCSFLDNETYIAQDVNDIFARITSGGVVFTDTGYTFGDLNSAQSGMVTGGVTRDINSCKVTKDGNIYKISKGSCFMNDGSAIMFDEDGQIIQVIPNVENYVYLKRNVMKNTIDIIVSETIWDENSVPLAWISKDGELYDRRKYARAKVDLATCGNVRNFTVQVPMAETVTSDTVTVDLGDGAFSYVILWDGKVTDWGDEYHKVASGRNMVPITDGEMVKIYIGISEGAKNELVHCLKDGQKLHIYITGTSRGEEYVLNMGVI